MESLGESLSRIASLPSASSAELVDVERLHLLDATPLLQADRDQAAANLAKLPADASSTRAKAERLLVALETKLSLGLRRDAIQAERPAECWCLGLGGRGARYIPPLDDGDAVRVWDQYCTCPEGAQAQARDDVERAHYRAYRAQYQVLQFFDQAQVPPRFEACSFDSYPVSPETAAAVTTVRKWATCEGDGHESLLLYGLYGTGKTGLAVSAMRAWIKANHSGALFITVPDLLDRIRATYGGAKHKRDEEEPSERELLDAVREVGLLVLDDLGAERPTDWVQEKLFAIINARHDQEQPTIFTSNLDPAALAAHLGERTAWRIVEMCQVIHLEGPNLRDRS